MQQVVLLPFPQSPLHSPSLSHFSSPFPLSPFSLSGENLFDAGCDCFIPGGGTHPRQMCKWMQTDTGAAYCTVCMLCVVYEIPQLSALFHGIHYPSENS
jgi:hypothetical protein